MNESSSQPSERSAPERQSAATVFLVFLRLGLTSFGGPVAHLGYFREEFVTQTQMARGKHLRRPCRAVPVPARASVEPDRHRYRPRQGRTARRVCRMAGVHRALGHRAHAVRLRRAGARGRHTAGTCCTGLKTVAVAVVAQAVWGMARSLCPDAPRALARHRRRDRRACRPDAARPGRRHRRRRAGRPRLPAGRGRRPA